MHPVKNLRSLRSRSTLAPDAGDIWNGRLAPKSGPSLTIIIYVRNIFELATMEASHAIDDGNESSDDFRCASDSGHRRPSRPCPKSAKSGSEPVYSMTSSARASKAGGRLRPIALAVRRLITSSYLVGACTGRIQKIVALG